MLCLNFLVAMDGRGGKPGIYLWSAELAGAGQRDGDGRPQNFRSCYA
jgi:hypothetical protein